MPRMEMVDLLPPKDHGNLQGGQYPFTYDPVYGLPIVRDIASYSDVLRGIRTGRVKQILWFFDPDRTDPFFTNGRCLVRYKDERVRQAVIPPDDVRVPYAMEVHGVQAIKIPLEPRHVVEYAQGDDESFWHPWQRWYSQHLAWQEFERPLLRRGPRIGPTPREMAAIEPDRQLVKEKVEEQTGFLRSIMYSANRMDTDDEVAYVQGYKEGEQPLVLSKEQALLAEDLGAAQPHILSQDGLTWVYTYIPLLGPVIGMSLVVLIYISARLVRGDLTDRMKMLTSGDDKEERRRKRAARTAFLEEEVPALVAKGATLADVEKQRVEINAKLGEKFEVTESEVVSTYDACKLLLEQGVDLSVGSTDAGMRVIVEGEQEAAAEAAAAEEREGDQMAEMMDMSKLNTARIRKAVDPRILQVKKRVREARRGMKRESKVNISDEIIFFDDVAGNEQAKVELMEVVDFFRRPERFRASGAKPPKGVLLVGPPGNGKTLMARAVAGESGVAFISSSASEFIEMYMGLGAARVRDLFATARKLAPCVIFIDELDAVGRARRSGGGGNDERDNTVNQLLTELDGFEAETQGIVVMGATNRKDVLDAALTRAGRFDRSIEVRRPDFKGRLEAVKVHLRDKPVSSDLNLEYLAMMTGGMSGAQIAGVCNTACFIASREGRDDVTQADMVAAVEQSKYGKQYDVHRFVSPSRKRRLAVLEAGIATTATLLPAIEPIEYVTIIPSFKSSIGRTVLTPNVGRHTAGIWTRRYLCEQLQLALAGRAAEEIIFGFDELSSLSQHRLQLARQIVHKLLDSGLSEHPDYEHIRTLGVQYLDPSWELGRWTRTSVTTDNNQTRSEWVDVDMEMHRRLNVAYDEAKALLTRNRKCLDELAGVILEREMLTGDEVRTIVEQFASPADLAVREEGRQGVLL